ncbi:MAG: nuclear transport factor 2 family protein [Gemmatimonadaceae bacterium]|nr:nuclear transport factor 2 family protein [Gemmatimonadaceae bacterium]
MAAAAVAHAQATPPDPATKGEVMAVVKRMFDGMRAADSSMVRSTFHTQLRMVTVAKGRDGQLRFTVESSPEGFLKSVGTPRPAKLDERIFNERVEIDGALASVWVDYNLYLGDKFVHCGIDHFLLARGDDGAWKIFSLADTRRTEGCKP